MRIGPLANSICWVAFRRRFNRFTALHGSGVGRGEAPRVAHPLRVELELALENGPEGAAGPPERPARNGYFHLLSVVNPAWLRVFLTRRAKQRGEGEASVGQELGLGTLAPVPEQRTFQKRLDVPDSMLRRA